jgi:transposase-like protein
MSKYTKEFKLEVVKHYASNKDGFGVTGAKFAIDESLVRRWVDVYKCLGPNSFGPRYERRTAEYKLNVLKQIQSRGLSLREARREFNIGAESSILVWQRQYAQGGLAALERKPRERPPMKPFKPPTKPLSELTQAELARYVEYLQAENAYLKKLEALVQSKKQAAQTKLK